MLDLLSVGKPEARIEFLLARDCIANYMLVKNCIIFLLHLLICLLIAGPDYVSYVVTFAKEFKLQN